MIRMKSPNFTLRMAATVALLLSLAACGGVSSGSSGVAMAASSYTVPQGAGSVSLTVVRAGSASEAISVSYATSDGTAVAGTNYTATSGTLQWAENDSTPRTLTVPISNVTPFAGTKAFQFILTNPSAGTTVGSPGSAQVSISGGSTTVPETVQLADATFTVPQGAGTVPVTVNRVGGSSGAISVGYATANGTAVAGTDYTTATGTLDWADGDASSKVFYVPISDATPFTGNKTFTVQLTNADGASIGSQSSETVTITGALSAPAGGLQLAAPSYAVAQDAGSVTITVDRIGGTSGAVSVGYATANGTASAGTNYTAASGTLQWANGDAAPKSFSVAISNSTPFSGSKTFAVALSNPSVGAAISSPGTATVAIAGSASPAAGDVALSASSYTVGQGAGSLTITVNRTGGSTGAITVAYATANGSAVAGTDYTAGNGKLTWESGDASSKSFAVAISNKTPFSGAKSFTVTLSSPTGGAAIISPSSAGVSIAGDAVTAAGSLQLSAASYTVAQSGGSVAVTVNRTGGSTGAISVAYATANGSAVAGTDYTATTGTLTWASGNAASKSFSVPVSNATPFSGNKAFTVALSSPVGGATLSSPDSASVTITGSASGSTTWVYYNGVFNWPGDWSWDATINYKDIAGAPVEGPYDIAVLITAGTTGGWQPYINSSCQQNISLCFDTTPYKYLLFSLKPTVAGPLWAAHFESAGDTPDGSVANISSYALTAGCPALLQWCSYKIPLSAFALTDTTILKFSIQDQSGAALFYVDNVGFSVN
jgi:hypothetical protein